MQTGITKLCSTLSIALLASLGTAAPASAGDAVKPFKGTVLDQVDLGYVAAGPRIMKMTLLEMQPGAEIPEHRHKGPGMRYVIDGAISISWGDRGWQTYPAGSAYFEAEGANHPASQMSAKNASDSVTRVIIVELLPMP